MKKNNSIMWMNVFAAVLVTLIFVVGMSVIGSGIDSAAIENNSIIEEDLHFIDVPLDGNVASYDAASGGFEWVGGGSGITEVDQWRLTTDFSGNATPIASNLERVDTDGFGLLGTGMSESSGIFTFPSTGYWLITFNLRMLATATIDSGSFAVIHTTLNNSSYNSAASGVFAMGSGHHGSAEVKFLFAVTNTSMYKVRFHSEGVSSTNTTQGDSSSNYTYMTFIRLGDI